mgnify:CR=1 FL=1
MKWISNYTLFKESKTYSNKNIITELCVSMVLLNHNFLDNLLDKGKKMRYSSNSHVFVTDLKNLLLANNRLELGKFIDGKCHIDDEISKINSEFEDIKFDIEKDWNKLVNSRDIARDIIDKLLPEEKVESSRIKKVYWLGPNKTDDYQEDIVLELNDGRQFSFFVDKSLSKNRSASFNKFADELIDEDLDLLYKGEYLDKWSQLTRKWIKIIYENSNKNIQTHIEKFINTEKIDEIGYFDFLSIRHGDKRYRHLGEYMKEFDRNILNFSDLLIEIWKDKDKHFSDVVRVTKEWNEAKVVIMNSKIFENLFTTSLKKKYLQDIEETETKYKLASGNLKMKLLKIIIEKMGNGERNVYYLNKGKDFNMVPSREFFRKFYNSLNIYFDYHVRLVTNPNEDNNFNFDIKLEIDKDELLDLNIEIRFSGGEMSGKFNAKYNFDISKNFNYLISKKQTFKNN